jgi:hypothetical protein
MAAPSAARPSTSAIAWRSTRCCRPDEASEALAGALADLNQRLRGARGKYDGVP